MLRPGVEQIRSICVSEIIRCGIVNVKLYFFSLAGGSFRMCILFLLCLANTVKSCTAYRAYSPCSWSPILHYHFSSIQHRDFLFTLDTVRLDCWSAVQSCCGYPHSIGIFSMRRRSSNLRLAGCCLRDAGSRCLFLIAPFLHVGYNCLGSFLLHRHPAILNEYHLRLCR